MHRKYLGNWRIYRNVRGSPVDHRLRQPGDDGQDQIRSGFGIQHDRLGMAQFQHGFAKQLVAPFMTQAAQHDIDRQAQPCEEYQQKHAD